MQFNAIGTEQGHGTHVHHVTTCMHEHEHYKKEEGDMASAQANRSLQNFETEKQQEEGQMSLSAWLDKTLQSGKRLLGRIWSGSEAGAGDAGRAEAAGALQSSPDAAGSALQGADAARTLKDPQLAAASSAAAPHTIQDNPYFSAVGEKKAEEEGILQRVRVKFRDISGHLTGNLFSAQSKNSFHTRQEQPKEDLRRHSKFHKDELEIDCILTDDSYLLDSYDRKGEYSKLSVDK